MNKHIALSRAVGAEFLARKVGGLFIIYVVITIISLVAGLYLVHLSDWWWLLLIPVFISIPIGGVAFGLAAVALRALRPALTKVQAQAIKDFVDKLERVADNIGTPLPFIVIRVVWDMFWKHEPSFLRQVASDSTTLHTDLLTLERNF